MADIRNSKLLDRLLVDAKRVADDISCNGVTRDLVLYAALSLISQADDLTEHYDQQEVAELKELLKAFPSDSRSLQTLKDPWQNQPLSMPERIIMASMKSRINTILHEQGRSVVTAKVYISMILANASAAIKKLDTNQREPKPKETERSPETRRPEASVAPAGGAGHAPAKPQPAAVPPKSMLDIVTHTKNLQNQLQELVLGQQHAVTSFVSGYFQAQLKAATATDERTTPLAAFLFAGPPGVGKTHMSEQVAKILGLPFRQFDMSEYTNPSAVDELCGSDENYRGSKEGLLTGFVNQYPRCVLLFDEIEKASLEVIHLFLQVLDAGRLRDNRTDKTVSFKDAIIIFTTNAGKNLYTGDQSEDLSTVSRSVILDALRKDINPRTREPFFPAAICSRFAAGNVLMFNYLRAHTLRSMVVRHLTKRADALKTAMGIEVDIDPAVYTAILLGEGAGADARTVKNRAESFWGSELYELYRLIASPRVDIPVESVKRVHISVDTENASAEMRKLFTPQEPIHALAYMPASHHLHLDAPDLPVFHYVQTVEEAEKVLSTNKIEMLLCMPFSDDGAKQQYLNREDIRTSARDFLYQVMSRFPTIPVLLAEDSSRVLTDEERDSYMRRGVRDFIDLDAPDAIDALRAQAGIIFQQNSLNELARASKVLHFETAQQLNEDNESAEILLFDLRLERAVRAEDSGSIMSMLSIPDKRFDDVIGADDAKSELNFFVSYMKDPLKYSRQGAAAPKGLLLYGPPGTGKTLLAKAFAAECKATYIATEGNQFFKKYVGEGPEMVHRLFATARRYAPSVIFIDEIDVIARKRTGRDTDMGQDTEAILTALFAEMDGFGTDPSKPVFVLAATNYSVTPDSPLALDPAMLRRFDRRILIDLPNKENRRKYLKMQLDRKPIFRVTDEELDNFADRSGGMSLAQLASVLDLAIRSCMQSGSESILGADLDEALEKFNSGEKHAWGPESLKRTARHESGHALVSWLAGDKPSYVTIVSRGNYGGYMRHESQEDRSTYTKAELLGRIRTSLAGRAAEIVCYGPEAGISTGASGDLQSATEIARHMLCSYGMDAEFGLAVADTSRPEVMLHVQKRVNEILDAEMKEAVRQIETYRSVLDSMVESLLERNSLNATDIDNLLHDVV